MTGRIPILDVQPLVGCARWPAKAVVGETFEVSATIFRDGHDAVGANVVLRDASGRDAPWTPMRALPPGEGRLPGALGGGTDRWVADVTPSAEGEWTFAVEAWGHPYATWHHNAEVKIAAGVDVELMLEEGALVLERAAAEPTRAPAGRRALLDASVALRDASRPPEVRFSAAESADVVATLDALPLRDFVTVTEPYPLRVERERALYGNWYEFFPRSEGGTLRNAAERLPAIAAMGFDVIYLPPVHPIGEVNRKGPNNTLDPGPEDPGSPWAIGSRHGGHDAVDPDLGTIEDFDAFVARAAELRLEVALDLALQCAPDHPWVTEHPEWFTILADGTIAYAENPPKKYQDIYPLNFDRDPGGIYAEVLRVVRHWMDHGVRIFRVDNPHTKPVAFWEWLLGEIRTTDPDVLFLAEAFTRPPMMHTLAKVGFHQSYTYFTWRNGKSELEQYGAELAQDSAHYMRPNFFVNTQDILTAFLQYGGPPAFKIRAVLASMLSPTYGVYSGYELFEHVALRPGSEEYLDSEKFQLRPRDWAAAEAQGRSLAPYLTRLNDIRRAHPALRRLRNLRFHRTDTPAITCFSKAEGTGPDADRVIVVVNLDPHATREDVVHLDMAALGFDWEERFTVTDLITGSTFEWGEHNYVGLNPFVEPAHILSVRRMNT